MVAFLFTYSYTNQELSLELTGYKGQFGCELLQHVQGVPKVRPKFVEMAKETRIWDMDIEVITAITEIRAKVRKRPYCSTITTKLGRKKFSRTSSEFDGALRRLVQRKKIENRGEDGEDSYFVLDISEWPELPRKENTNDEKNDMICS